MKRFAPLGIFLALLVLTGATVIRGVPPFSSADDGKALVVSGKDLVWQTKAGPTGPTGSAGANGATGATGSIGPTGPNWTTCAQASSSFGASEQTGSCGKVVFDTGPTLTAATLTNNTNNVGTLIRNLSGGSVAIALNVTAGNSNPWGGRGITVTAGSSTGNSGGGGIAVSGSGGAGNNGTSPGGAGFSGLGGANSSSSAAGGNGGTFVGGANTNATGAGGNGAAGTGGAASANGGGGVPGVGGLFTGGAGGPTGTNGAAGVKGIGGNTGGIGVWGVGGANGVGGWFQGTGTANGLMSEAPAGLAAVFTGDTTSPLLGAILITPQDTNPNAACAQGTLFVKSGTVAIPRACFWSTTTGYVDISAVRSTQLGLTARAGGGQASATNVCAVGSGTMATVTNVASPGDSVKLPDTPVWGSLCTIKNATGTSMNLFPGSGDQICFSGSACDTADAARAVAGNTQIDCWAENAGKWHCR